MSFSKSDSAPSDRPSEKPGVPSAWLNQATRLEAMSQDQTSIWPVSRAIATSSGCDSSGRCGSGGEGGALTPWSRPDSGVSMERYFRLPRMVSFKFDLALGADNVNRRSLAAAAPVQLQFQPPAPLMGAPARHRPRREEVRGVHDGAA